MTRLFAAAAAVAAIAAAAPSFAQEAPAHPSFAPVIKRVSPAVVNIGVRGTVAAPRNPFFDDPGFRRFFYRELLPELRRQGKTIVAATHDDRYFDAADRVIKLDYGRIVEQEVHRATA